MPSTLGDHQSLPELASAMDYHRSKSGLVGMIEYLVIHGVNDSEEDAHALAAFCLARQTHMSGKQWRERDGGGEGSEGGERATEGGLKEVKDRGLLNLIPYNPTEIGSLQGFVSPSDDDIREFRGHLSARGVGSLVRWTSAGGRDAQGACGQLVVESRCVRAA
jgi:adenine C2-methylase RlmN of 23S rRNA A2503 and tRNA A37